MSETSETADITAEQVWEEIEKLAAESPDYVYPRAERPLDLPEDDPWLTCRYVHHAEDGSKTGGCIVGQALIRLGVPVERLEKLEGRPASLVLSALSIDRTNARAEMVQIVQQKQDQGATWGEAVARVQALWRR